MIKLLLLTAMLDTSEVKALPPSPIKIERRKRGKSNRGRKRGGSGLR